MGRTGPERTTWKWARNFGGVAGRPVVQPPHQWPPADSCLLAAGSRGHFWGAFHPNGRGDIEDSKSVAWVIERDTPDIDSLLVTSGRLYFYKGKSGQLSCVDAATGKPHYMASRNPGLSWIYASPIAAGGHIYLTGRSGTTVVIEDSRVENHRDEFRWRNGRRDTGTGW